jgi:hypothetical protein
MLGRTSVHSSLLSTRQVNVFQALVVLVINQFRLINP